jgi:hypothetical protein
MKMLLIYLSAVVIMILPFDYIGYKRLSENKHFPNHRWYSDATWGGMGEGSPLLFQSYF